MTIGAKTAEKSVVFWYSRRESNPQRPLRRGLLYPFNYGSVYFVVFVCGTVALPCCIYVRYECAYLRVVWVHSPIVSTCGLGALIARVYVWYGYYPAVFTCGTGLFSRGSCRSRRSRFFSVPRRGLLRLRWRG